MQGVIKNLIIIHLGSMRERIHPNRWINSETGDESAWGPGCGTPSVRSASCVGLYSLETLDEACKQRPSGRSALQEHGGFHLFASSWDCVEPTYMKQNRDLHRQGLQLTLVKTRTSLHFPHREHGFVIPTAWVSYCDYREMTATLWHLLLLLLKISRCAFPGEHLSFDLHRKGSLG